MLMIPNLPSMFLQFLDLHTSLLGMQFQGFTESTFWLFTATRGPPRPFGFPNSRPLMRKLFRADQTKQTAGDLAGMGKQSENIVWFCFIFFLGSFFVVELPVFFIFFFSFMIFSERKNSGEKMLMRPGYASEAFILRQTAIQACHCDITLEKNLNK